MLPPIAMIASIVVLLLSMFGTPSTPVTDDAPAPVEAVLNGSAAAGLDGWSATSEAGPVTIERITGLTGAPESSGVRLSRSGGAGTWAYALVSIHRKFFQPGQFYRMTAYVRDLAGKGRSYGLTLANGQYTDRPTVTSEALRPEDDGWKEVSRTFQAATAGGDDTAVYLALPNTGSFQAEVTGVSVQKVTPSLPPKLKPDAKPAKQVGFPGKAGAPPDRGEWNYETGGPGWGHGEPQIYTDSTQNARLDGKGGLEIVVRRNGDGFTSARLNSNGKIAIKPGSYFEADVTGPTGTAIWPAVWLMGTSYDEVGWPRAGELDVYEASGGAPTIARNAVHLPTAADPSKDHSYGWAEGESGTELGEPMDAGPHKYGVYFSDKLVRYYIDRKPAMTIWAQDAKATGRLWPFGKSMFIIMNVAIAPNADVSKTTLPRTMTVHSINVWKGGVPFQP